MPDIYFLYGGKPGEKPRYYRSYYKCCAILRDTQEEALPFYSKKDADSVRRELHRYGYYMAIVKKGDSNGRE